MFFKKRKSTTTLVTNPAIKHDEQFNMLREKEYKRLDDLGHIYLDYTGGNLYAKSQLEEHQKMLSNNVFGNPHSTNPSSQAATTLVADARKKVIDFFNAEDYHCIFTQNASGALKIVGECYPFEMDGQYLLLADNHNSVNGIREYCAKANASFHYATIQHEDLHIDADTLENDLKKYPHKKNKLFSFPAQSNVTGVKHDLGWVKKAQDLGWDVLLDAAAFVPTSRLDLKQVQPQFVSISFYKIFGYPTGLGCLLVRKDAFPKLCKRWFAGGTVNLASVLSPSHFLADGYERFENGTINYLDIPAVKIGLNFIDSIGMDKITERVGSMMCYLVEKLEAIKHPNGKAVVKVFGPKNRERVGGTAIMSFFDIDGKVIPFEEIEKKTNAQMISIRSGCFCNPGIDEINNCLSTEELSKYFSSRDNGNYYDMIEVLQKMRGATRVSVGIATTQKDLDVFISFVEGLSGQNP